MHYLKMISRGLQYKQTDATAVEKHSKRVREEGDILKNDAACGAPEFDTKTHFLQFRRLRCQ